MPVLDNMFLAKHTLDLLQEDDIGLLEQFKLFLIDLSHSSIWLILLFIATIVGLVLYPRWLIKTIKKYKKENKNRMM